MCDDLVDLTCLSDAGTSIFSLSKFMYQASLARGEAETRTIAPMPHDNKNKCPPFTDAMMGVQLPVYYHRLPKQRKLHLYRAA